MHRDPDQSGSGGSRTPNQDFSEGGPQHKSGLEPTQPVRRSSEPQGDQQSKESNVESTETGTGEGSGSKGSSSARQAGFGSASLGGATTQGGTASNRESGYGQTTGASTQPGGRQEDRRSTSAPGGQTNTGRTPGAEVDTGTTVSSHPDRATAGREQPGSGGQSGNWWNRVESGWNQMRSRVREEWDQLTDDDVEHIGGRRERLENRIRDRYGITDDEARRQVDEWGKGLHPGTA